jgi:hypothetical protein
MHDAVESRGSAFFMGCSSLTRLHENQIDQRKRRQNVEHRDFLLAKQSPRR